MRAACVWLSTFSSLIPPQVRKYCIYCIYCNGYLYLYMYILYLLRWGNIVYIVMDIYICIFIFIYVYIIPPQVRRYCILLLVKSWRNRVSWPFRGRSYTTSSFSAVIYGFHFRPSLIDNIQCTLNTWVVWINTLRKWRCQLWAAPNPVQL